MPPRLFACTLLPFLALPAAAQSPAESDASTLKVYARETIVDVTVTDKWGAPVHGLKQEDFTLREDNKPQIIRSFEEFSSISSAPPAHKLPPNVHTNLQLPPPSNAVNILLLDGLNTAPPDASDPQQVAFSSSVQALVKQQAIAYVRSMPPGTRIAVLELSRNLRLLQTFTSDSDLLAAAIGSMELDLDGRATTGAEWCVQQDVRNRATLEALRQIAAGVPAIKGKKNLIWFSSGFPTLTDPSVTQQPDCRLSPTSPAVYGIEDQSQNLLRTYALFNAAQIAVFPICARGLSSNILNPLGPGARNDLASRPRPDQMNDPQRTPLMVVGAAQPQFATFAAEEQLSLDSMAEATGGTAFYNTNDLAGAVAKAIEAGANHYTLAYTPPGKKFDWGHHTIKVAVDRLGLTLAYRRTYDAADPASLRPKAGLTLATALPDPSANPEVDPAALMPSAMSRTIPTSAGIMFDVAVQPSIEPAKPADPPVFGVLDPKFRPSGSSKGTPLTRYSFEYAFPAREITFSPGAANTHLGALDFDLAAFDAKGDLVTSLSQTLRLPLSDAAFQQLPRTPFRFFQQLDLAPGQMFVRIGILDRTSRRIGTLDVPVLVTPK